MALYKFTYLLNLCQTCVAAVVYFLKAEIYNHDLKMELGLHALMCPHFLALGSLKLPLC